jgi:hypothetical protein
VSGAPGPKEEKTLAKLSYPTNRKVACPLLIDVAQLEALDQIIDRHAGPLEALRDKELDDSTEKDLRDDVAKGYLKEVDIEKKRPGVRERIRSLYYSRDSKSATLYLTRGKEIQAERFSEAISQPIDEEEVPLGLALHFRVGNVEARVRLEHRWEPELTVDVEPNDVEAAQELFGALSNWASAIEAPKWHQKWLALRPLVGTVLAVWFFFGLMAVPLTIWSDAGKEASIAEARKLLAGGINQNNQQRALELILAIESEYNPGVNAPPLGLRYWSYFGIGILILVMAAIIPKVSIGVWKGRRQLKRWRSWITTVTVTIPLLLIGSLILPWLLHILGLTPPS